jgi:hypothetical protein
MAKVLVVTSGKGGVGNPPRRRPTIGRREGAWGMPNSQEHSHLRRQAIVIVSQLPDNTAEALTVLNYARHLVTEFLEEPEARTSAKVRQNSVAGSH